MSHDDHDNDWWGNNVGTNPQRFGLSIVGSIHDPDACYSYDDVVVWQHEDGRLFWGRSSGCSCDSPFDSVNSVDQLNPIVGQETFKEFRIAVEQHCLGYSTLDGQYRATGPTENQHQWADKLDLIRKVMKIMLDNAEAW